LGEQSELTGRPSALADQARFGESGFEMGALEKFIAERYDFVGYTLEEDRRCSPVVSR
jgi:hypothetical protein